MVKGENQKIYQCQFEECLEFLPIIHKSKKQLNYFKSYCGFQIFTPCGVTIILSSPNRAISEPEFFAINAVVMIVAEGPLLSWLTKKISDGKINLLGFIALTASFIFLLETEDLFSLIAAALTFGLGFSMTTTAQLAMISKIVPQSMQGTLHGQLATIMAIGGVIGLITGGILFEVIEAQGVYLMAAIISGILLVMSIRILKLEKLSAN